MSERKTPGWRLSSLELNVCGGMWTPGLRGELWQGVGQHEVTQCLTFTLELVVCMVYEWNVSSHTVVSIIWYRAGESRRLISALMEMLQDMKPCNTYEATGPVCFFSPSLPGRRRSYLRSGTDLVFFFFEGAKRVQKHTFTTGSSGAPTWPHVFVCPWW